MGDVGVDEDVGVGVGVGAVDGVILVVTAGTPGVSEHGGPWSGKSSHVWMQTQPPDPTQKRLSPGDGENQNFSWMHELHTASPVGQYVASKAGNSHSWIVPSLLLVSAAGSVRLSANARR
jgi:hypothetical protein